MSMNHTYSVEQIFYIYTQVIEGSKYISYQERCTLETLMDLLKCFYLDNGYLSKNIYSNKLILYALSTEARLFWDVVLRRCVADLTTKEFEYMVNKDVDNLKAFLSE